MADAWGIEARYWDAVGNQREVSDATIARLRAILAAPSEAIAARTTAMEWPKGSDRVGFHSSTGTKSGYMSRTGG